MDMKIPLALAAVLSLSVLGGSASAFPVAPISQVAAPIEQVRLVCNQWGRCWRTGPRYYGYGYDGARPYYGRGYGYYGGPYGYYCGPGVCGGGPGFWFPFGFFRGAPCAPGFKIVHCAVFGPDAAGTSR